MQEIGKYIHSNPCTKHILIHKSVFLLILKIRQCLSYKGIIQQIMKTLVRKSYMFTSWAHPISFRHTEERRPETRQVPSSITVVTQQDGLRVIIMATLGTLGLIFLFFLFLITFLFHLTFTCYCKKLMCNELQ